MKCPYCGHPDTRVIDSDRRKTTTPSEEEDPAMNGGKRFTTYEKVETIPLIVIKKTIREHIATSQDCEAGIFCGHAVSVLSQHSEFRSRRLMISSSDI